MPGIHSYHVISKAHSFLKKDEMDFLLHENTFFKKDIYNTLNAFSCITIHDAYPHVVLSYNGYNITILGAIYNLINIEESLFKICDALNQKEKARKLITEFVDNIDGDFIIQIYHAETQLYCVFNDFLGRLPLYYSTTNNTLIVSSEIKFILKYKQDIQINKYGLAEYLLFGFHLADHTNFNEIKRFPESHILISQVTNDALNIDIFSSSNLHFNTTNVLTKKECIKKMTNAYLKAVEHRVKYAALNNYNIIADLSGGYDSRTVLAGLEKYTNQVDYYTFEYIQDESPFAKGIFESFNNPGSFTKLKFNNKFTFEGISDLVFKTDGLVDYYATSVCYNDLKFLKENVKKRVVRFGGLGGEFFRHPYKYYSIINGNPDDLYESRQFYNVSDFLQLNHTELKDYFIEYFNSYPEKNKRDRLKRFYYEYYRNQVGIAAEDRERIHFWTVHPMWSASFLKIAFNEYPLESVGYKFYIEFMKHLDKRLLNVPIFRSPIKLNSLLNIKKYELNYRFEFLKQRIKSNIKNSFLLKNFLHNKANNLNYTNQISPELFEKIKHESLMLNKKQELVYLSDSYLDKHTYYENLRQLTLLFYLNEVVNFRNSNSN